MTRRAISTLLITLLAMPALAAEMPARKAGLWEIKTGAGNGVAIRQCIDPATDQIMQSRAGTGPGAGPGAGTPPQCSKRDVQKTADTVTIDSTCTVAGRTVNTHAVVTGSFDSAYTMTVTSQGDGIPAGAGTMTMSAKWLGPCAADQRPGDMIMPNGTKINILDLQKRGLPGAPPPPH
jgi:Protein of unknown function (DUF3617)